MISARKALALFVFMTVIKGWSQAPVETVSQAEAIGALHAADHSPNSPAGVAAQLPGDSPPAGGYFPPSIVPCDITAPADTAASPADHTLPSFQTPLVGQNIYLVQNGLGGHGNIRVVIFDGPKIVATFGLPSDPTVSRASYSGPNIRYRMELCVAGAFVPITAPIVSGKASYNGAAEFWTETYGSELTRPTANNILFSISWRWIETIGPALHVVAKHKCEGIGFQVATNYAIAYLSFPGHEDSLNNMVDTIGVTIHYDGSAVAGGPGIGSESGEGEGLPGPGDSDHTPAGAGGGVSGFPYGAPISKSLSHAASVEVSNQIRAVLIGVCSGFTATGLVKLTDGKTWGSRVHSN